MKKILAIICVVLFFGCKSKSILNQEKTNVLFIGNSLTYFHDMPTTLQSMLNEKHYNFNVEQSTFDGMTLQGHLTHMIIKKSGDTLYTRTKEIGEITETEKKIASKKWDIIILQEGSGNHYFPDAVKEVTGPTVKKIEGLVNNKDCKFIMFNTWTSKGKYPRKKECIAKAYFDETKYFMGEEVNEEDKFCSPERLNLEQDVKILSECFDGIKKQDDLTLTNHCQKHYNVRKKYPEIELYDDDCHPSEAGSFLNACVFYNLLTGEKASKLIFFWETKSQNS
ncbi:DUF4886 domain-containing protein [Flavobacterium sp.]|uniref:DUF4886 domain-containing protein n=1 Tax=Flavobacterium sp. TaxID=239 RepID=UPI0025CE665E|nr:DUF4886 domain-containing protein [Flavobacterium sp.]